LRPLNAGANKPPDLAVNQRIWFYGKAKKVEALSKNLTI
jgi:hypothetical protein